MGDDVGELEVILNGKSAICFVGEDDTGTVLGECDRGEVGLTVVKLAIGALSRSESWSSHWISQCGWERCCYQWR